MKPEEQKLIDIARTLQAHEWTKLIMYMSAPDLSKECVAELSSILKELTNSVK